MYGCMDVWLTGSQRQVRHYSGMSWFMFVSLCLCWFVRVTAHGRVSVCMHVCVGICMYACMLPSILIHKCRCTPVHSRLYLCMHACRILLYIQACVYECIHVYASEALRYAHGVWFGYPMMYMYVCMHAYLLFEWADRHEICACIHVANMHMFVNSHRWRFALSIKTKTAPWIAKRCAMASRNLAWASRNLRWQLCLCYTPI